ncbi:YceI family protein [Sphaerotilus sp.]|uniref:YceI family protein n=1 Tax=Sphaerotilus sp. TaxID=2093942 RepID=UPI00286DEFA8|nr:YceI family protein [Sphaerotilus sp.]
MHALPALFTLCCALAVVPPPALAQTAPVAPSNRYQIDPSHTFVHWEVLHMGTSTSRGRFDKISGNVAFDRTAGLIDLGFTVDTASVNVGNAAFDGVLRGAQLLDAMQYPQAWFVARRATFEGDVPRQVHGELTLRGQSQPLTLTARRWKCGLNLLFRREVCGGDFEATLSRAAFGMTLASGLVSDEVRLLVQVEAIKEPAP